MENPFELIMTKLNAIEIAIESLKNKDLEKKESKLMNVTEVAEYLNLAISSIYGLVHQRKIPSYKVGKKLYFEVSEIDAWIHSGKNKTNNEINLNATDYITKHS